MISDHDLEVELRFVRAHAAGSLAGVFRPDSVTWRVNREAAIFLGAGRALLLQLAHPWVATAVAEHSQVFSDPIGRFRRTFKLMFTMVFGTLDHALGAARRLHRRHAAITGVMPRAAGPFSAGSRYWANETSALRWVHATLVETALVAYGHAPSAAFERRPSALLRRKLRVRGAVRDFASQSAIELGGLRRIQHGDVEIRHADRDPEARAIAEQISHRNQPLPPQTQVVPSGYGWNAAVPAADSASGCIMVRPNGASPNPRSNGSGAYIPSYRTDCATSVPTKRPWPDYRGGRDPTS